MDAVAVTGRFQPFHQDHLALVQQALTLASRVIIGVTNADDAQRVAHPASAHRHLDSANPFSFQQRRQLIDAALRAARIAAERVQIIAFPLDEPARWPATLPANTSQLVRVFSDWEREKVQRFQAHAVPVIVMAGDPQQRISGTDIRRAMASGESWQHWVPPGARELLQSWQESAHA